MLSLSAEYPRYLPFFYVDHVNLHMDDLIFGMNFQVSCLLILVADLLVYAIFLSPVALDSLPFRVAPYIRVVFFVLNIRYCGISHKYLSIKVKLNGKSAKQILPCLDFI